jgi:hypothetical protein
MEKDGCIVTSIGLGATGAFMSLAQWHPWIAILLIVLAIWGGVKSQRRGWVEHDEADADWKREGGVRHRELPPED